MDYQEEIERMLNLLRHHQAIQSERDGIARPDICAFTTHSDQFTKDVSNAAKWTTALYKLIPMMMDLNKLGRKLEKEEKIKIDYGDDYSEKALEFVLSEHGLVGDNHSHKSIQ